jgi:hypothetical protein
LVGFGVLQQQINLIRRFFSNPQTPDSGITLGGYRKVRAWLDRNRQLAMTKWNEYCP